MASSGRQFPGRAFAAGVPAAWVAGDEVYGGDGNLRRWLEQGGRPYVLAVRSDQFVWVGSRQAQVGAPAATLPGRAWHAITIAPGSEGLRRHAWAWAWLAINHDLGPKWRRRLLVRKSLEDEELAYYPAAGPARTTPTRPAQVAGSRWSIEGGFESSKQEVGLADYEVRSRTGWHQHIAPPLLAHAVLAAVRELADGPPPRSRALAGNRSGCRRRRSGVCWSGCSGAGYPRLPRSWIGRSGVGRTRPMQDDAIIRTEKRSRRISYNCSTIAVHGRISHGRGRWGLAPGPLPGLIPIGETDAGRVPAPHLPAQGGCEPL